MRALVLQGADDLVLRDVAAPRPRPDEVVVEVAWSGICGTDVHGYAHAAPLREPPIVMGHEFTGRIADTGELVVVNPRVVCGACTACAQGQTHLCRGASTLGVHRPGGFAERVAVPERNCIPLPPDIAPSVGALTEPLAVGLHAAKLLDDRLGLEGRSVGVIGAGLIGLCVALQARARGADVTLADLAPGRRRQASRHGIADVVDGLEDVHDVTVEAVGSPATRRTSLEHLAPGGASVWIGLGSSPAEVDVTALVRGERSILTSYCYTESEFRDAVGLCAEFEDDELDVVPLAEGSAIFRALHERRGHRTADTVRTVFATSDDHADPRSATATPVDEPTAP